MQYSIRTLLIVMLLVCFLSAALAFPVFLRRFIFGLMYFMLTVLVATTAIYGRGRLKVFCVGATAGFVTLALKGSQVDSLFGLIYQVFLLGVAGVIAICVKTQVLDYGILSEQKPLVPPAPESFEDESFEDEST